MFRCLVHTRNPDYIVGKATKIINLLSSHKNLLPRSSLETIYRSYARPVLEYADIIWDNCNTHHQNRLEQIQIRAAQIVSGAKRRTSHNQLYNELGWNPLSVRRCQHKLYVLPR